MKLRMDIIRIPCILTTAFWIPNLISYGSELGWSVFVVLRARVGSLQDSIGMFLGF